MNEFIYTPRKGHEVTEAAPPDTSLYTYSELASLPLPSTAILRMMNRNNIILLQNPKKMNSGHWISLSFNPEEREIYFFSSYGGKPDEEKNSWMSPAELEMSGQKRNFLNDGLKQFFKEGWTIYYNDYPYQRKGDKTASCGIWTTAFLNSRTNPDTFARSHHSLGYYYKRDYLRKSRKRKGKE